MRSDGSGMAYLATNPFLSCSACTPDRTLEISVYCWAWYLILPAHHRLKMPANGNLWPTRANRFAKRLLYRLNDRRTANAPRLLLRHHAYARRQVVGSAQNIL